MGAIKDTFEMVESYVDKSDKIIKVINWCKSVICILFICYSIDGKLSNDYIDFGSIFTNDSIINYCLKISYVISRLIFSLCLLPLVIIIISLPFYCYYYFKKSNKIRLKNIKSLIKGSYLRLVNALEYFYIFLFIGHFFNKDFIFEFFNSYQFPSIFILVINVFSIILLIPTILYKVIMPFLNQKSIEKNKINNEKLLITIHQLENEIKIEINEKRV